MAIDCGVYIYIPFTGGALHPSEGSSVNIVCGTVQIVLNQNFSGSTLSN